MRGRNEFRNRKGTLTAGNILYNRGIAFVTYKYEANAQFAKEAMQHQSMDMDEILNVRYVSALMFDADLRWATEDPNPGEKKLEDKRIAIEGNRVIASKLDPQLVEASQSLRALEEGNEADYYPIEAQAEEQEEEDERPTKRARGDDANAGGGILGGDALENIKFYAEMARKQAEEERNRKVPPKSTGMALLGEYGSGDESD